MYDLTKHIYAEAFLQPVHQKDEFHAFCTMVERQSVLPGTKNVYIGDRGYCSYNNMAHVIETGQFGDIKKLKGFENEYRLRIGDLRVLFTVENDTIIINDIKSRGQAYKDL